MLWPVSQDCRRRILVETLDQRFSSSLEKTSPPVVGCVVISHLHNATGICWGPTAVSGLNEIMLVVRDLHGMDGRDRTRQGRVQNRNNKKGRRGLAVQGRIHLVNTENSEIGMDRTPGRVEIGRVGAT